MKTTIAIIAEYWSMIDGLTIFLNNSKLFKISHSTTSGLQMLEKLSRLKKHPDLLLIDAEITDIDSFDLVTIIQTQYPHIKCVALSNPQITNQNMLLMYAGCLGWLNKNDPPNEYLQGLETITNGEIILKKNNKDLIKAFRMRDYFKANDTLQLITLCCTEKTNKEIAKELSITIKSLDGKLKKLYKQLNVKTRYGVIIKAKLQGWVL